MVSTTRHNKPQPRRRSRPQVDLPALLHLRKVEAVNATFPIINTDRSAGTMLSNEISKVYKDQGLPQPMNVKFNGSVGQSFRCVPLVKGVKFEVEGDANDYWGKGLSGGTLVLYPDAKSSSLLKIISWLVTYVSTVQPQVNLSFAVWLVNVSVRNSGAKVVVEGVGDHGCEYMTGGVAGILGSTGRNFAAV
ncbi:hypothetical protein OK016_12020 [Vibrio chagasii]|nr:hypothetical protein [Vibrio chagasii]